jgi:hypothetical protein
MPNPFTAILTWIKTHKLTAFLLALVIYLCYRMSTPVPFALQNRDNFAVTRGEMMMDAGVANSAPAPMMAKSAVMPVTGGGLGGVMQDYGADRMVTQSTYFSIKVKNVAESIKQIEQLANEVGGFFVNSSLSSLDQGSDGSIAIRVPSEKREDTLTALRGIGVRVVSESVQGTDITDQYQDITEQLRILTTTKTKFESLLNKAETVGEMLEAQRELLSMQQQIDSLKGQQDFLQKSADTTLITAYLSTDELALPYSAPSQAWRPGVVFKEAVRSLLTSFRSLGNGLIWIGVYAPIWIPVVGGYIWWAKKQKTSAT